VAWQTNLLVVANRTAGSDELIAALKQRAEGGPVSCTVLMPADPRGRARARQKLDHAVERMRGAGLDVTGIVGADANPLFSVAEVWDANVYDEIVVSTLPTGVSHWLNLDLPQRIARLTNAPVVHVESLPEAPAVAAAG
jgi:hypothetical protein